MSAVCIITARGGSKRIPGKNIRPFLGKPILAYSIEAARKSGLFDRVMVSTDSGKIAEVARAYGAEVPFLRSEKTAGDFATTADVVAEVLDSYRAQGLTFDILACLLSDCALCDGRDPAGGRKKAGREQHRWCCHRRCRWCCPRGPLLVPAPARVCGARGPSCLRVPGVSLHPLPGSGAPLPRRGAVLPLPGGCLSAGEDRRPGKVRAPHPSGDQGAEIKYQRLVKSMEETQ